MTAVLGAIAAVAFLIAVCVMCVLGLEYLRVGRELKRRKVQRPAVVVSRSPLLEGTWRDAEPGETPGTVEPDDAPAPVYIARTPLKIAIARAEAAGRTAERRVSQQQRRRQGVGRHRAELRDDTAVFEMAPEVLDLATTTQVEFMHALEAAGEEPPSSFGPREPIRRQIEWAEPPLWKQDPLDVEMT